MKAETIDTAATLLMPRRMGAEFTKVLNDTLIARLTVLGHEVRRVSKAGRTVSRIDVDGAHVVAAYCGAPVTPEEYGRYRRPAARDPVSDAEVVDRLTVHQACVILSARPAALSGYPAPARVEIEALVQDLAQSLREIVPIGLVHWQPTGRVLTLAEFRAFANETDSVRNALPLRPLRVAAGGQARTARPVLPAPPPYPAANPANDLHDPDEVVNLFADGALDIFTLHDRLDDALAEAAPKPRHPKPAEPARKSERPAPPRPAEAFEPANDTPDLPGPATSDAAQIRAALYPDGPDFDPKEQPLAHRLSIYTLNTTLLIVALPVGAAMLTYNALGRESLTATARAMAITGVGLFYGKLLLGQQFLAVML